MKQTVVVTAVLLAIATGCSGEREFPTHERRITLEPQQESSLGFSFADVRENVTASFVGELNWQDLSPTFSFQPDTGSSAVEHRLEVVDASLAEVTPCWRNGVTSSDTNVAADCRVYLEIEATASVVTADDNLDDAFVGSVRVFGPSDWTFTGETQVLSGAFRVLQSPYGSNTFAFRTENPGSGPVDGEFGILTRSGDSAAASGTATGAIAAKWSAVDVSQSD